MGKKSKYPDYASGSVTINGRNVATATKNKNGTIETTYNMSNAEKQMYDSVQKNLSSSISNLFNITDANKKLWNKQLETYKKTGIQEINDIYDPMQTALKNDIAGRFGNLDNSIFLDKLRDITNNKAKAVASLSDSMIAKQDELYSTELQNRMNYISLLSGLNSDMINQMLSYTNLAKSNAESGNNYNNRVYNTLNSNNSGNLFGNYFGQIATTARNLFNN